MGKESRVAIIGVTGFVGNGLPEMLSEAGMACTGVSRSAVAGVPGIDAWQALDELDLEGHRAVVNLAGAPINCRWTAEKRRRLHDSRVGVTRRVVEAIRRLPPGERPEVLVNASAVGIYGDRGDEVLVESSPPGNGYLADLCHEWEGAALEAESLGVRVVRLRVGVVLGAGGGAFEPMRRVFGLGLGGRMGDGGQWMPWIHLEDLRAVIVHSLSSDRMAGAVNGCAPAAERNVDFSRKLAAALHRPALFPAPVFALKLLLGEFGGAIVASQRVRPAALEADGFAFRFPTLESALGDLVA